MMVLGSRAAMGYVLGRGAGAAAAAWWLSGGVSAANAIAVYQPKGAASLAASYSNLANPGTYDAAPGVAPTWAAATGWTFGGAQYLKTGIVPTQNLNRTIIVRFSDAANNGATLGTLRAANVAEVLIKPLFDASNVRYGNGSVINVSPNAAAGVLAVAGATAYRNGAAEPGTISAPDRAMVTDIWIGCQNQYEFALAQFNGKIQAIAIYNTTLSAVQVAAISAAMAAL